MPTLQEAVTDFLAQRRMAVVGVSRGGSNPANIVYRKLKSTGYEVFPVTPHAERAEGDACYSSVSAIPGGVDAVVIGTRPDQADAIIEECAVAGIRRVWMHRSFGGGSVSETAVTHGRERGLTVIAGGCPMMFCEPVDVAHKCMRFVLRVTGGLPREV